MTPEEYLAEIESLPEQVLAGFKLGAAVSLEGDISKIVVSGMGGSAIPGSILASYLDIKIPVFVNRNYTVPEFVDSKTLFFAVSYSGNTEETLEAAKAAFRKNAKIVAITSGGKLRHLAEENKFRFVLVPPRMQPRAALPFLFFPMLRILQNSGIIKDVSAEVKKAAEAVSSSSLRKQAESLAGKLVNKIPLIYASEKFAAVAYRWQTQLNENSKVHAFSHVFPELDHNQIVGYTSLNGSYYVIILEDAADHRRIKKRMAITRSIVKQRGVDSTLLDFSGESLLGRMFSAIHLGDLTSYFLSQQYGIDPVPVDVVEDLKGRLGPFA